VKKITIDFELNEIQTLSGDGVASSYALDTEEGFNKVANAYLRAGWDNKYVYSFMWMGRPIIQLPDDVMRIQEIIYQVKPDIILEIGVAHGGSLIFYASLLKAMGRGRVIGVDIKIREQNRKSIEAHEMYAYITLVEGNSIDPVTFDKVSHLIKKGERVMVLLDGKHTYEHVLRELEIYAPLISINSYIVAMDGIQRDLVGAPRSEADWAWNNSANAAEEFVRQNPQYIIDNIKPIFNEGNITKAVTYWPSGYIKKIS